MLIWIGKGCRNCCIIQIWDGLCPPSFKLGGGGSSPPGPLCLSHFYSSYPAKANHDDGICFHADAKTIDIDEGEPDTHILGTY